MHVPQTAILMCEEIQNTTFGDGGSCLVAGVLFEPFNISPIKFRMIIFNGLEHHYLQQWQKSLLQTIGFKFEEI
jgi:hypothetical protein